MGDQIGYIKTDASGTDNRYLFTNLSLAGDGIDVAHDHGVVDARDIRLSWCDTRGDHGMVKSAVLNCLHIGPLTEDHLDTHLV